MRSALALGAAGPFRSVQSTWNVLEPSAEDALAQAKAAGWRVVIKEALANGRLSARGDAAALGGLVAGTGAAPDALALAAALTRPWADVVLSGASTAQQLTSNLSAVDLVETDFSPLTALRESPDTYWRTRAGLRWN